jgi:DNA-binding transcriptional ArsR family regulator
MRALAHPTRVRMLHLLRAEALSASELARRLGIRFGSAQYHLRSLERAGIALRVGERIRRGGTEILFEVPHGLWVDVEPDAPLGMRQAMNRAYVAELLRRMDAAATERHEVDQDVLSTREIELDADGVDACLL